VITEKRATHWVALFSVIYFDFDFNF